MSKTKAFIQLMNGLDGVFNKKQGKIDEHDEHKAGQGDKKQPGQEDNKPKKFEGIGDPLPLPVFSKPKLPPSKNRARQMLSNYFSNHFYNRYR